MNNKNRVRLILITGIILLVILFILYFSFNFSSESDDKEYFISIGYDELNEKIDNKEDFILIISSTTCSHCAEYKPIAKEVANDYKIEIYYTDVNTYSEEDSDDFDTTYGISGTPTTLFFNNGEEISIMSRIEGSISYDKLVSALIKYNFLEEE